MPSKPEKNGVFSKVLTTLRDLTDTLSGKARSAAETASTTAKSAVDSASSAAATAGAVIKENPGKSAAVAGAVIATAAAAAAAAMAGQKVSARKTASSAKPAVKKTGCEKTGCEKASCEEASGQACCKARRRGEACTTGKACSEEGSPGETRSKTNSLNLAMCVAPPFAAGLFLATSPF